MTIRETKKQFHARRIRTKVERAKVAVMDAQQEVMNAPGRVTEYLELLDAALRRLDNVWTKASHTEREEMGKPAMRERT